MTASPERSDRIRAIKLAVRRLSGRVLHAYFRVVHRIDVAYHPDMPSEGAFFAVVNHTSLMDVPVLMAADPFRSPTSMIIKREMYEVPFLKPILRAWDAIPVDRHGKDIAAIRQIRRTLSEGRGLCIAPEGTRSADGRLGPLDPVLVRLILRSRVPTFPVALIGTRESLPKGSVLPRPARITLRCGPPIVFPTGPKAAAGSPADEAEIEAAGRCMRDALAALLPDHMKPAPETPVLRKYTPPGTGGTRPLPDAAASPRKA